MKVAKIPTVKVGWVFAHDTHGVVRFTKEAEKLQMSNPDPRRIFLETETGILPLRARDICPINNLSAFCIQIQEEQSRREDLEETGVMTGVKDDPKE